MRASVSSTREPMKPERQEQRKNLCREYTKLGRAMSLREALQAFYTCLDRQSAEADLAWWCAWALRSRLNPFQNLAKTIRVHWDGVLAYFDTVGPKGRKAQDGRIANKYPQLNPLFMVATANVALQS